MAKQQSSVVMALIVMQVVGLLGMADVRTVSAPVDFGIAKLNELIRRDDQSLCLYISCQEPLHADDCPEDTIYMEGVAQFGCCGACVQFRQIGEKCTGSIDPEYGGGYTNDVGGSITKPSDRNVVASSWCNYHLYCKSNMCQLDWEKSSCLNTQMLYDEAVAGINGETYVHFRDDYRWRPQCTVEGDFAPKQCKGPIGEQRCVCVDPDGNSLYGAAFPLQMDLFKSMNCMCSRRVWELQQQGVTSVTLHCQENGNYEPLQCEDEWCYCMDPDTAQPYGSRLPEKATRLLPCYNKTEMGEKYLRRCESQYEAYAELVDLMAFKGVQGPSTLLKCDPDGSYNSKQCDTQMCRCYDKYMDQALSYPSGDGCRCARDRQLYLENKIQLEIKCKVNTGTYEPIQPRGKYAFCVDSDGVRAGPMVYMEYIENLSCNTALSCQAAGGRACNMTCSKCPDEAYYKYDGNQVVLV
ncbi:uncharacterized protein LOC121856343 [Homarus americanus]|uniref:uncharacterized protein LOC121856343 n=1 Tax=Homarus americanus TaxID=6706 RepID=UPI001C462E41|nr:uncharacterized protein LOC121856343 [Homarus americanus]